ncbi:hypothetical protein GALMADRAFT_232144 [Galerina marginata CBS 339.88]|uniref:Uncharacterized protein n=1 Tax=Galerina marginata (strain CBS 339.88) TaxID=685588 RepID=A0A067S903_GALM3|nr:hypothetical protein GALMADRAFT_232144 [Galerina marginata CBS 339.88]
MAVIRCEVRVVFWLNNIALFDSADLHRWFGKSYSEPERKYLSESSVEVANKKRGAKTYNELAPSNIRGLSFALLACEHCKSLNSGKRRGDALLEVVEWVEVIVVGCLSLQGEGMALSTSVAVNGDPDVLVCPEAVRRAKTLVVK